MKRAVALSILALAGCAGSNDRKPEATIPVSNPQYKVERLFTDDHGNSLYRFADVAGYVYYVSGPGGAQVVPTPPRPTSSPAIYSPALLEVRTFDRGGRSHNGGSGGKR